MKRDPVQINDDKYPDLRSSAKSALHTSQGLAEGHDAETAGFKRVGQAFA